MKKNMALALALVLATTAQAQVLDVKQENVTYRYNAKDCGEMTYNDGSSVTIGGRTYALSDVDFISMNSAISVDDNSVSVTYSSSEAQVVIAGNIAPRKHYEHWRQGIPRLSGSEDYPCLLAATLCYYRRRVLSPAL